MLRGVLIMMVMGSNVMADPPYQPTWESLRQHQNPAWFRDAKFGIYFHWGVYSVPAFQNEWYPHHMYGEDHQIAKHHVATYGDRKTFGYKDFIPRFKAERFEPEAWATLFKRAGARFAGPVAEHADGFAMWDSQLTTWDAKDMGPRRDLVGELEQAIRAQGLKFIATFHHQWLWAWYPTYDERFDTSDPAYAGLYGPRTAPGDFRHPVPSEAFCRRWLDRVNEVVDRYQPDLLWFDSRMETIGERFRQDMLAHYYNQAATRGREVVVTYKNNDLPARTGIVDLERGRMSGLSEEPWLNDDSIDWKSWCHVEHPQYKSADRLIDGLVDIVSKNGNLLLNITPRANGEIPEPVTERLLAMGDWLALNGEAIYGTRPWVLFGEGPTEVKGGHFSEKRIGTFTSKDIRFTVPRNAGPTPRGHVLYVIALAWPGDGQLNVASLGSTQTALGDLDSIHLLGHKEALTWNRSETGLTIQLPRTRPCDHAFVFKLTQKEDDRRQHHGAFRTDVDRGSRT